MKVDEIRQIGQEILNEPREFNMSAWVLIMKTRLNAYMYNHSVEHLPPCGTAMCFAGEWAKKYLANGDPETLLRKYCESDYLGVEEKCREALSLPNSRLFYESQWPLEFKFKIIDNLKYGTREYAEFFVKTVLEDYINTNGWQFMNEV